MEGTSCRAQPCPVLGVLGQSWCPGSTLSPSTPAVQCSWPGAAHVALAEGCVAPGCDAEGELVELHSSHLSKGRFGTHHRREGKWAV